MFASRPAPAPVQSAPQICLRGVRSPSKQRRHLHQLRKNGGRPDFFCPCGSMGPVQNSARVLHPALAMATDAAGRAVMQ